MIIDFHVHGKITSTFPFDKEKFLLTINEAKENGLDSIAVVEHCGADNFLEGYNYFNDNYPQIDDYYNVKGVKVFYGTEITTKQVLDILFIGNPKLVLELREKVCKTKDDEYIDINELFKLYIPEDILVILAHPYRDHDIFPELEKYVINRIDAIEFNSKDLYKHGMENMKDRVRKLANKLNLPIVCGSDTHYFIQVSSAKNIFVKECTSVKDIKEEIKTGKYKVDFSYDLNVRVKSAIIIKKLICNK